MKSVIDKLKYQLVLPPVILIVAMAMEGEQRDIGMLVKSTLPSVVAL